MGTRINARSCTINEIKGITGTSLQNMKAEDYVSLSQVAQPGIFANLPYKTPDPPLFTIGIENKQQHNPCPQMGKGSEKINFMIEEAKKNGNPSCVKYSQLEDWTKSDGIQKCGKSPKNTFID